MNSDIINKYHDKLNTEVDLYYWDTAFKVIPKQST